jgi:hypothetical protein
VETLKTLRSKATYSWRGAIYQRTHTDDGCKTEQVASVYRKELLPMFEAAPDLLETLKSAVTETKRTHDAVGHPLNPPLPKWVGRAEAAIAKATCIVPAGVEPG